MSNEEKAIEYYRVRYLKGIDREKMHERRIGFVAGAEWKDQQFKEYLEKKREEYMSQRDDANMWAEQWAVFHALTCTMHNIINELFGE